jgi:hypothetical protein
MSLSGSLTSGQHKYASGPTKLPLADLSWFCRSNKIGWQDVGQ